MYMHLQAHICRQARDVACHLQVNKVFPMYVRACVYACLLRPLDLISALDSGVGFSFERLVSARVSLVRHAAPDTWSHKGKTRDLWG